jgi:outer membrane protein
METAVKRVIRRTMMIMLAGCSVMMFSPAVLAVEMESSMRAALGNSASLAAARQSWVAARENIGVNAVTTDWSATGNFTGKQSQTDSATSSGFVDSTSAAASITLSKNLYDGGQTEEGTKLDLIMLRAETAGYESVEQNVLMGAIEAHLAVVKAQRDVALNEDNAKRMQAHVDAARVRVEAGAATPTRLAEAEARYARAKSTLIIARTALRNAEDEFHSITGNEAVQLAVPAVGSTLPTSLANAEEIGRTEHPDIRRVEANEDAAMQGFDALLSSVKPKVSFDLSASDTNATGTASDKTVLSAQIKLTTPLMVTTATRAKSRNLSAKLAAAQFARDDMLRQVGLNVRKNFRSLETARSQVTAVQAEVEASRLVADGIRNEFEFGQKTSLDVQDAEQDVNDAELRLVSAQHDLLLSAYRLQAALGRLTSRALGLDDVLGPLEDEAAPAPYFSSILPFSGK